MNILKSDSDLEKYVDSLTDDEKERYRELIEEFRLRDAQIHKDFTETRLRLTRLGDIESNLLRKMKELEMATDDLLKQTSKLYLQFKKKEKMDS